MLSTNISLKSGSTKSFKEIRINTSPYKINGQDIKIVSSHRDLGVTIDVSLKFHIHIDKVVRRSNNLTSNILSCTLARDASFILNVYTMHIRPLIEYCSSLWFTGYYGDLHRLECVQRRWTRVVEGLADVPYGERLKRLGLFSLQGRFRRADMILTYKIFNNLCSLKPNDLFQLAENSMTRGHCYKICKPRINLEPRKRSFAVRVVGDWNGLGCDTVEASSLNMFKTLLHRDLGAKLYEFC